MELIWHLKHDRDFYKFSSYCDAAHCHRDVILRKQIEMLFKMWETITNDREYNFTSYISSASIEVSRFFSVRVKLYKNWEADSDAELIFSSFRRVSLKKLSLTMYEMSLMRQTINETVSCKKIFIWTTSETWRCEIFSRKILKSNFKECSLVILKHRKKTCKFFNNGKSHKNFIWVKDFFVQ